MAVLYKGFAAYYCDPSTHENLQFCGNFNYTFATSSGTVATGTLPDDVVKGNLELCFETGFITGIGMRYADPSSAAAWEALKTILPSFDVLSVLNNTGGEAYLKLIAANGSYAISTMAIHNGNCAYGASYQPQLFNCYFADGTPVDVMWPLTATGAVSMSFGELPASGTISPGWSHTITLTKASGYQTYVSYNDFGISQSLLDWFNGIGPYVESYGITYDLENCSGDSENPSTIPINATITPANFTPDETYEFVSTSCWIDGDGSPSGTPIQYVWEPETGALRIGPVTSDITIHVHAYGDPYADIDGEADLPGGGTVPVPGLPGLSAVSTGMLGLFAPSVSQMQQLADFMWTDFGGTGTTEVDVLKEIVQAIKRNISNPLDYVVGLNIIPSQGLSIGAAAEVRFGFVNTGISMPRLTNQYFTVNCGTVYFPPVCKDTFLDYAPYSKFSIYLPYIGYKDLNANDCVGHTIGVIYHGDTVTGGITAYITKDGNVFYQYSGCCALTLPLSSDSWGTTISGALQVASALGVGVMSGGAAGLASAAVNSTASVAGNPSLLSPQVARSGAVSGGAGLMGVQHPVIIREAVSFHDTTGFNTVSGYPSWYYKQLAEVSGYTTVVDVHLHDIPATQGEIEEIEQKLKEGVIM